MGYSPPSPHETKEGLSVPMVQRGEARREFPLISEEAFFSPPLLRLVDTAQPEDIPVYTHISSHSRGNISCDEWISRRQAFERRRWDTTEPDTLRND